MDIIDMTHEDRFDADIEALFGDRMRADEAFAEAVYSAIYFSEWKDTAGDVILHTMRAADNLVNEISGFSFYCEGDDEAPLPEIASALLSRGWTSSLVTPPIPTRPWWKFW